MAVGITDSGINWAARVAQAAAVAVAGYNTAAAIKIANNQEELARNYYKIAREQKDYYNEVFVPCEDQEIEEACSAELYVPQYDRTAGRMLTSVRVDFRDQTEKALRCVGRYCTGKKAAVLKDLAMAEAGAVGTALNMARRYEQDRKDAKDDLRWARRSQALNRGRDMEAQAAEYSGFAYGLFGRLGAQAGKGAAGAVSWLAYDLNRNDTVYPTRTPLQRPRMPVVSESYPLPNPELEVVPQAPAPAPRRPRIRG